MCEGPSCVPTLRLALGRKPMSLGSWAVTRAGAHESYSNSYEPHAVGSFMVHKNINILC